MEKNSILKNFLWAQSIVTLLVFVSGWFESALWLWGIIFVLLPLGIICLIFVFVFRTSSIRKGVVVDKGIFVLNILISTILITLGLFSLKKLPDIVEGIFFF